MSGYFNFSLLFIFSISSIFGADVPKQGDLSCTWNLERLYASPADWDAARVHLISEFAQLGQFKGKLNNGTQLYAALVLQYKVIKEFQRIASYANHKKNEDLQVAENLEREALLSGLQSQFGEALSFFSPEIIRIGQDGIRRAIAEEPRLREFEFALNELLRYSPHTLDEAGENLLARYSGTSSNDGDTFSVLVNTDLPWETVELSTGEEIKVNQVALGKYRDTTNREDRDKIFNAFYGALKKFERTLGSTLYGSMKAAHFQAVARNQSGRFAEALFGDNFSENIFSTLLAETDAGLPVLDRYEKLRARILKLPDLRYHDLYLSMGASEEAYPLERSKELLLEALKPLGDSYVAKMKAGFESRWSDVYPRAGKLSGAYMDGSVYDVHPFMLYNYTPNFEWMLVWGHEWGHAMHSVIANEAQPFQYAQYKTSTAETASIANELLLQDYLLKNATSKDQKIFLISQQIERIRQTFFRQVLFSEFEYICHKAIQNGEALSGEKYSRIYLELLKKYYGHDRGVVTIDEVDSIEWAYVPHMYFSFYMYQYSTAMATAAYFVDAIVEGKPGALDNYMNVLKAGGSEHPNEIFKKAGVDLEKPDAYRALIRRMSGLLDQLEELLK